MRVTVLAFHPESVAAAAAHLKALVPGVGDIDLVYPSLALDVADDADWSDTIAPALLERLRHIGQPLRVLHVPPARFVDELFDRQPPTLVVLAYTEFTESVAVTANMLAMRRFPVMMLGYDV